MRQRPAADAAGGATSLFIDTAPRPVNVPGARPWPPQAPVPADEEGAPKGGKRLLALSAVSLLLFTFGWYLTSGNVYSHLHRRIAQAYAGCEWPRGGQLAQRFDEQGEHFLCSRPSSLSAGFSQSLGGPGCDRAHPSPLSPSYHLLSIRRHAS